MGVTIRDVMVVIFEVLRSERHVVMAVGLLRRDQALHELLEVLKEPGFLLVDDDGARRVRGIDQGHSVLDATSIHRVHHVFGHVAELHAPTGGEAVVFEEHLHRSTSALCMPAIAADQGSIHEYNR